MFWVYLLNQGPYRTPEHWSTIFITPFIILNTKNRGDLGVLGAKLHAKVRQIWCVVWKKGVRHQKTVSGWNRSHFQTARHCFPWKYRIISTCIKNPHPKKTICWHFMDVFLRGGRGPWEGGPVESIPLWKRLWNKILRGKACNLASCLETCRAFGCKKQRRKTDREQKVIQVLLFFCYVFGTFIFVLCVPGFSKITFVILDEFWFCFLHFVRFTNPDHRAK